MKEIQFGNIKRKGNEYGVESKIRAVLNDAFVAYEIETLVAGDLVKIRSYPFSELSRKQGVPEKDRAVLELFTVGEEVKFRMWNDKLGMPVTDELFGKVIWKHTSPGNVDEFGYIDLVVKLKTKINL